MGLGAFGAFGEHSRKGTRMLSALAVCYVRYPGSALTLHSYYDVLRRSVVADLAVAAVPVLGPILRSA